MTLNDVADSADSLLLKRISKAQLSIYISLYGAAPIRVFRMDGGLTLSGRDGFVFVDEDYFKVRWHTGIDELYILRQNDVIGIKEKNKSGYQQKRLFLNSGKK